MSFVAPIAGLLAGGIGVLSVLVMYMLRLRRRPVQVSSTMLWTRAIKDMEGNIPFQRLSPTVLLWIHVLIVLLLALAIARPVMDRGLVDGHRVFVLIDTTASMNAKRADGRSGLDRAKAQAIARVESLFDAGRLPRVSVLACGLEPRAVMVDSTDRGRLIGEIGRIEGTDQPGAMSDGIGLAESMIESMKGEGDSAGEGDEPRSDAQSLVWIYSDGGSMDSDRVPMRGGFGVSQSPYGLGELRVNLGIVGLSATRDRSEPELCRVFVRVQRSQSGGGAGVVVRLRSGRDLLASKPMVFEADQSSVQATIEIHRADDALIEVSLDGDDGFEADQRAWVRLPDAHPTRVVVVAPDGQADPLLVDMLEVVARAPARAISADDPIGSADLVVYDRASPETLPGVPTIGFASLMPDEPGSDQLIGDRLIEPGTRNRLTLWDRTSPMMRDASMGTVSYQRSVVFSPTTQEQVLARDRDGAVIVQRVVDRIPHVRVGFALHDSDWAVQVGFPIFLINAFESLLPGVNGVGQVYTTREPIRSETDGAIKDVGVIPRVGVREIAGRAYGISLLDAHESMLVVRDGVQIGSDRRGEQNMMGDGESARSIWRWLVLAAVGLMTIEWLGYVRKVSL
ncbi:MAG: BatA domain-containing protein [Phycisphaerales bacterium]